MIAKTKKGGQIRPLLFYVEKATDNAGRLREQVTLLVATLPGRTARELAVGFEALHHLRPGLRRWVQHTILSFRPDVPPPDDATARAVVVAWAEGMGFQDYAAHRHDPRHLHIALSRIRRDGAVVSDQHDYARSERIVRRLQDTAQKAVQGMSATTAEIRGLTDQLGVTASTIEECSDAILYVAPALTQHHEVRTRSIIRSAALATTGLTFAGLAVAMGAFWWAGVLH